MSRPLTVARPIRPGSVAWSNDGHGVTSDGYEVVLALIATEGWVIVCVRPPAGRPFYRRVSGERATAEAEQMVRLHRAETAKTHPVGLPRRRNT